MKKTLVAMCVMAAAGAASAQSSVTLFGIADVALQYGHGATSNKLSMISGGLSTSRLGFRGVEDLGGGLNASFWLESQFNADDGSGAGTNTNNQASGTTTATAGTQGLTFNRRSTVSLSGGFGEVRLGRDYEPAFWNYAVFDPFGLLGVGASQVQGVRGGSNANVRASNSIGYFLPKNLGGFYGQAQYHLGDNSRGTPTQNDGNGFGLRLGYAAGPFDVAASYGHQEYAAGDWDDVSVGGSYDFGMAKLMGMYGTQKRKAAAGDTTLKGFLIGATADVGPGEVRVAFSQGTTDTAAAADPRTRKFALGYIYNLSKRTAVYTSLAFVKNSNGANVAVGGAATGINQNSTGLDLGVRHSF